jgi:hypothetical protein
MRLVVLLLLLAVSGHAEPRVVRSGTSRGHLLELFTSEGCSSCPPMEAWLAGDRDALRREHVIPLAFHVDYWDGIGWKDPFSSPRWTARQQAVASTSGSGLYTPELALDGVETKRNLALTDTPATVHIELTSREDGDALVVTTKVTGATGELYLALTEDGLVVDVPRGENAGRRLAHEAVVRTLLGPLPLDGEQRVALSGKRDHLSIVAFVQGRGTHVLEAVALPLH